MPKSIGTRSVADPEITKGGGGHGARKLEKIWRARAQSAPKIFVWPRLFDHLLSRRDCGQVVSYPSDHSRGKNPSPRGWAAAVYETSARA